jgi:hypothetical protein
MIRFWETSTRRERWRLAGHPNPVLAVTVSPSGRLIASGAADGTIRIWDADTGRELQRAEGHRGGVQVLAFTADSKTLVSGGADTSVLLWDAGDLIHALPPAIANLTPLQLEALWSDLAGEDDEAAYQAVRTLSATASQSIPLLHKRVRPVVAEAVVRWLAELDDDQFAVREKATEELAQLGKFVEGSVRKALEDPPSVEARRRMLRLLNKIETISFSPERARALRALEVLERIGSTQSKQQLEELAKGAPDAELTREAKAALERLKKRSELVP